MDSQEDHTKKPSKKEVAKAERLRRKQELAAAASAAASGVPAVSIDEADPLAANYGEIQLIELQSKEFPKQTWTEVGSLDGSLKDATVLIRGRVHSIRAVSKKMAFVVLRERGFTVQCVDGEAGGC